MTSILPRAARKVLRLCFSLKTERETGILEAEEESVCFYYKAELF